MNLVLLAVALLACMVLVLSGMLGYVYFQQQRLNQSVQSLAIVISTHLTPPQVPEEEDESDSEDDRESVPAEEAPTPEAPSVEHVEGPPAPADADDLDGLEGKTVKELQELLTKKGIPFGKRDAKTVLLQLLKATA